ncbi:MAG: ribonuclease G [Clostridiaceae bacterium BRH_c20a]|nr:MAG: ribonuclease G [Clostridiaceae bacterium BRH_c20a]
MNKEIIVQSNEDETQVVVLEDEQLVEIYIERSVSDRLVGSIYKGKVENVLPGMQAAFVDIGMEKNAFLYVEDAIISGSYHDNGAKLNIRDILKEGQEVLVQVVKEPVGNKGPRVTRQLTLPGRFLVFMPSLDYVGISRRICEEGERERLKNIVEKIKSKDIGAIIRTVAEGASEEEIAEDLEILQKTWQKIKHKDKISGAPILIHKDLELVKRILRDVVTDDVRRITVNSQFTYEQIMELAGNKSLKYKVNLVEEQDLFTKHNIRQEMARALKRKVWLKSGGYIVIDQTEALASIDVNTGKYVGSVDLADTVLKINLEATVEIARQLRLRNIGGIIIIDFIDMENEEHRKEVLMKLEEQLHKDKTKAHILGITSLGLVEMTRKKMRHSLSTSLEKICPCCEGKGRIFSENTIAIKVKEELRELASRTMGETILVNANPDVTALLIGPGGTLLKQLENRLKKEVIVRGRKNLALHDYDIQVVYGTHELKNNVIPVEETQLVKVRIEEPHSQRPSDGIGRIEGYIIDIENGGRLVGKEVLVEIVKLYRTNAKAVIVQ